MPKVVGVISSEIKKADPEGLGRKNFKIWTQILLTDRKNQQ